MYRNKTIYNSLDSIQCKEQRVFANQFHFTRSARIEETSTNEMVLSWHTDN